jgi:cation:H+ antiporter
LIIEMGWFALGLCGLYFGAEWLVGGASRLALLFGIKPIVVGLTIVAFGTSSPELVVSLTAALKQSQGLALGNVIGSNIANVGLVLGLAAMFAPLKVGLGLLRRELPIMIGVSLLFVLMTLDLVISYWDGLVLVLGLFAYTGYHLYGALKAAKAGKEDADEAVPQKRAAGKNALGVVVGIVLLVGGAHLMVQSGIAIAQAFGISEVIIGIMLIAVGTSLPELATSIVSARRNESDICISNVIGSNIFNTLLVIGAVGLVTPLTVDRSLLYYELPVMLLFSLALAPLMKSGFVLSRLEGAFMFGSYVVFIIGLVWIRGV